MPISKRLTFDYFEDAFLSGLNVNSSISPTLFCILNPESPAPATPNNEPMTAAPAAEPSAAAVAPPIIFI